MHRLLRLIELSVLMNAPDNSVLMNDNGLTK